MHARLLPALQLALACIAMLATLPGRSFGIGLITEPLIADLDLSRAAFGAMNFIATIVGASLAVLCGWLIDRFGLRLITAATTILLGGAVILFSGVTAAAMLLVLLTLVRGLGQSALSTASMTIIGKWFTSRLSIAMAIFSIVIAIGFASLFSLKGFIEHESIGWRTTWMWVGISIVACGAIFAMLLRRAPARTHDGSKLDPRSPTPALPESRSLSFALRTPAFWALAIGSALFNLIIAGVTLWSESILEQLGFPVEVYQMWGAAFLLAGVTGSFITGWLARRLPIGKLMGAALFLLAIVMATYPFLTSEVLVAAHAALLGATGGMITVLFFTAWATMFGRAHLGRIQGTAQVLAVIASATGPFVLAGSFERFGSYDLAFFALAPISLALAVFAWLVRLPGALEGQKVEEA